MLTHQHMDHIGLLEILASRSGAEVAALDRLAPWLADYRREMDEDDGFSVAIMLRNGVPRDVVHALRAISASFRAWGAAAHVTRPLADGELLEFASRSWRVLHRPGHSPSDTVFWDEASGELFGGDHLIKHISSNPLVSRPLSPPPPGAGGVDEGGGMRTSETRSPSGGGVDEQAGMKARAPAGARGAADLRGTTGARAGAGDGAVGRPRALMIYMDSLRLTRAMDLGVVLAGHGEPIEDHRALIDERFRMHERRADKLCALIDERPRNAYGSPGRCGATWRSRRRS